MSYKLYPRGSALFKKKKKMMSKGRTIQNMLLAAWADGVGSCVVSLPHEAAVKPLLGIPDHYKIQQAIAFGYPERDVVPTMEGNPLKDVLASLGRKPISELVHQETWGRTRDALEQA